MSSSSTTDIHRRRSRRKSEHAMPSERPGNSSTIDSLVEFARKLRDDSKQLSEPPFSRPTNNTHPVSDKIPPSPRISNQWPEDEGVVVTPQPLTKPVTLERKSFDAHAPPPASVEEIWRAKRESAAQKDASSSPPRPPRNHISPSPSVRADRNDRGPGPISVEKLHALQTRASPEDDNLNPLNEEDLDPGSFDLVSPAEKLSPKVYSLEQRSELLFSKAHLRIIFSDHAMLHSFASFLQTTRPASMVLLTYYLNTMKALRALAYSNAVLEELDPVIEELDAVLGPDFAYIPSGSSLNYSIRQRADAAFEVLARDDLPAYITHTWMRIVSSSIKRRITGTLPPRLRELSEGLAEVFCITDPSRKDNPIVFASAEFYRTTQYGINHAIGRNCRFLQGPKTNPFSIKRIRSKVKAGQEHHETFLNYRRDGSPFMNLVMVSPLFDSHGKIRYWLGAQVDVSGLTKDCAGLDSFRQLIVDRDIGGTVPATLAPGGSTLGVDNASPVLPLPPSSGGDAGSNPLLELSELFSPKEIETIATHGGRLHLGPGGASNIHAPARYPSSSCRSQTTQPEDDRAASRCSNSVQSHHHQNSTGSRNTSTYNNNNNYTAYTNTSSPVLPPANASSPYPQPYGASRSYSSPNIASTPQRMVPVRHPTTNTLPITAHSTTPAATNHHPVPHLAAAHTNVTLPAIAPQLSSMYENYLLVRPYPSLRVLFASPSLRLPGMLQSHFMARIGGSKRVRGDLERAFADGRGFTARVMWASRRVVGRSSSSGAGAGAGDGANPAASGHGSNSGGGSRGGRARWIHCTPLVGTECMIGVWMIVMVDEAPAASVSSSASGSAVGPGTAPASVASHVHGASTHPAMVAAQGPPPGAMAGMDHEVATAADRRGAAAEYVPQQQHPAAAVRHTYSTPPSNYHVSNGGW